LPPAARTGSDTVGGTVTNVLYQLLAHPAVYQRLQAEIDGAGDLDPAALAALPYLNAVM